MTARRRRAAVVAALVTSLGTWAAAQEDAPAGHGLAGDGASAGSDAGAAASQEDEAYTPFVAPASDEAARSVQGLELAEGLEATLFAAEPMLANPVCLYVADDGAVYVGETFRHHAGVTDIREHMDWLDDDLASRTVEDRVAMIAKHEGERFAMYSQEQERVRLIRDLDGDHVADRATVFADGFDHPAAGIGAGLLAHEGDVYYTCIPDLWLLRDEDGDDRADVKRVLSTGYGVNVALLGHDLHGLRIGPDKRLYFSSGDRGFVVETEDGVLDSPKTGAVLRCNLDGSGLEVVHSGLRNPQELVFDEYGNLWTGDNNSDGGDQARWVRIVPGGDSGWRYPYQWIDQPNRRGPWNDEKLWHPPHAGQAAYVVPPVANLGNGPSGLAYYPGTGLDPRWRGHFFLADFRGGRGYSGIHAFTVRPRGASFELGPVEPFVWSTLVTDCDFGPDGGFYVLDWVEGWNKTGKGRIYRVVDPVHVADEDARSAQAILAQGFGGRGFGDLKALLFHADQRVRQGAQFRLAELGSTGIGIFTELSRGKVDLLARLHSIWGIGIYARRDPNARALLEPLLDDPEPEVRAQALKVLGEERHVPAADKVVARISDEHPRVRFFAAIAAGRLHAEGAVEPLRRLLEDAGADDPDLRHAAVMGLVGTATADDLARLAQDPSPHVRMGALLVLRRRADPSVARFLGDAEPLLVVEAARAIHDVPIEAARPALAACAVPPDASNALVRRVANANFRLGGAEAAARVAALAARDDLSIAQRREALDMLRGWGAPSPRDRVTNFWWPLPAERDAAFVAELAADLAEPLDAAPPAVRVAWTDLVAEHPTLHSLTVLQGLVGDTDVRASVRVGAFRALEASGGKLFGGALDLALADADGALRAAGLTALERLAPAEALPRLGGILDGGELAEQRAAYAILGRSGTRQAAELLLDELRALGRGEKPAELALDLVLAAEASGSDALAEAVALVQGPRAGDPGMAPFLDGLFGGDPEAGRAQFERADLSCLRCHAVDDEAGETVGPDLRGLSARLGRRQVLEAIVHPNRRTTPGYDSTVLYFRDGTSLSGRVLEDGLVLEGEEGTWLRLQDADGAIHEVFEGDVEERRPDLSPMPEDLAALIDRRQMRDLLAYLATL